MYKHTRSTTCKRLIGHATNVPIACPIVIMSSSTLGISKDTFGSIAISTLTFTCPLGRDLPCSVSPLTLCNFPWATKQSNGDDTNNLQLDTPYIIKYNYKI